MAGIYIHIPFCKTKCNYCNFYSETTLAPVDFAEAIRQEIDLRKNYLADEPVETVYFGGGTPSLLAPAVIKDLVRHISGAFHLAADAEITLEANPDDLHHTYLQQLMLTGVNRLSIGIQSFQETDLRWLQRRHTATQSVECLVLANEAGFYNLSVDLIYGIPTSQQRALEDNLRTVFDFDIPHVSAYCLTVEPGTPLDLMVQTNSVNANNERMAAHQFAWLMACMKANGYEHYEISNFAKHGFHSRHNAAYWQQKKYLGLGPAAHSYDGRSRQWNVASIATYLSGVSLGRLAYDKEVLDDAHHFNEYVMTALRTSAGINKLQVKERFGEQRFVCMITAMRPHLKNLHVMELHDAFVLTDAGKFFADGISADLFV